MKSPPIVDLSRKTVGPDGRLGRRTVGFEEIEAACAQDGAHAPSDYRYHAFYAYLLESPSFLAVQAKVRGESCVFPLPKDWKTVEPVARDFIDASDELPFVEWWRSGGLRLFSTVATAPGVASTVGQLTESEPSLRLKWGGADAAVVRIGLMQTRAEALRQVALLLERLPFDPQSAAPEPPKYVFVKRAARRTTLEAGITALLQRRLYGQERPLWWVGNALNLIPSQSFSQDQYDRFSPADLKRRKQLLAVAASRLSRAAGFVAENAARGRFPCADPFPAANTEFFRRKFGRPRSDG